MKKKLTAILIALTLAISLLPISAAAAVSPSEESRIMSAVSQAVKDYAAKVYQADSADNAFSAYFKHGFFANGANMTLKETDAMVAALFNACVTQDALTRSITKGIVQMQELNEQEFFLNGGPGWHNYYYTYNYTGYRGAALVYSNSLGKLLTAKDVYDEDYYVGPTNRNDEVMELLVGTLNCDVVIRRIESKQSTTVYSLELQVSDRFSFDGDYSHIADKGFDTSTDDTLNNLGYLMTFMGLDEFDWSYQTTLQVEVPNFCDHSYDDSYHWTLDTNAQMLIPHGTNGFKENSVTRIAITNSKTGEVTYQYKLDETVILSHNKPWVVEYDLQPLDRLSLSALDHSNSCYPYLLQHNTTHLWIPYYESIKLSDNEKGYRWHYMGVEMKQKFSYSSNRVYSFHIENIVSGDGSNMPWVTVYDDTGAVIFGPEPLNDYWTSSHEDSIRALTETDTNRLSGTDIIINYIGSRSNRITHDQLDLRIWENGKDGTSAETQGAYIAPTCTEQGGYPTTCADCGYIYLTNVEPALGHDFSEYADDGNTTCTADGTKTRTCSRCDLKDTVTVTGSAFGHSYGEYTDDGNTTCTADGTKSRTCAACGETDTVTVSGSALGHNYGLYSYDHNAACTADGTKTATCKNCGGTDTVPAEGSATGHTYTSAVTAPTCTAQGFTTYTCHCGDSYVDDYTEPAEHTEVDDPAVAPTCTTKGLTAGKHCAVCGTVTVPQDLLAYGDHVWDEGTIVKAPGTTSLGTILYTCIHCGEESYMSIDTIPTIGFTDVPADAYYAEAVAWAKKQNITSGISDSLFGSDMGCTRGQVVTFLWRAAGSPEPATTENPFKDVNESDYFCKPVLWAVQQGITSGIAKDAFGPNETCTRGQIVTFLYRANNSPAVTDTSTFSDVTDTDWYAAPVLWAAENTITGGIGNNQFGPNNTCTRAQVVMFLYKVYG